MQPDALEIDRPSHSHSTTNRDLLTLVRLRLAAHERALWGVVIAVCLADLLSTTYGLANGQTEGNPVVRQALADGGLLAFATLKAAALSLAFSVWVVLPRRRRVVVPLGLALPWTATTLVNVAVLLG